MKKTILTQEAYEKLSKDYEMRIAKRAQISEEIKIARDFGDLKENAEYHAAREAQSHNESEINEIKYILDNFELIKTNTNKNTVSIGSRLKIEYLDCNDVEEIKIVTKFDSDPLSGLISYESPLGEALIGKKKDAVVQMQSPDGPIDIKILEIMKKK